MQTRIYAQEGHPTQKLWLGDEERLRAHLAIVRPCHDFLPVGTDGKFYLPNRKKGNAISDISGVWFIGGALQPFMSEEESMKKVLARETGFNVDISRLRWIRRNRYYMNGKTQGGFAHDALCDIYAFVISPAEIESIKLDPKEYEGGGLQPYGGKEVEKIADPFVRAIFLDLWFQTIV